MAATAQRMESTLEQSLRAQLQHNKPGKLKSLVKQLTKHQKGQDTKSQDQVQSNRQPSDIETIEQLTTKLQNAERKLQRLSEFNSDELDDALSFLRLKKEGVINAKPDEDISSQNRKLELECQQLKQELDYSETQFAALQGRYNMLETNALRSQEDQEQQIKRLTAQVKQLTSLRNNVQGYLVGQGLTQDQIQQIEYKVRTSSSGNVLYLNVTKFQNLKLNLPAERMYLQVELFGQNYTSSHILISTPLSGVISTINQVVSFVIPFQASGLQVFEDLKIYLIVELLHDPSQKVLIGQANVGLYKDIDLTEATFLHHGNTIGTMFYICHLQNPILEPIETPRVSIEQNEPMVQIHHQQTRPEQVGLDTFDPLDTEQPPFGSQESITQLVVDDMVNEQPVLVQSGHAKHDTVQIKSSNQPIQISLSSLKFISNQQLLEYFRSIKLKQFFLDVTFNQCQELSFESDPIAYDGLDYQLDIQIECSSQQFFEFDGKFEVTVVKEPTQDQSNQNCVDIAKVKVDLWSDVFDIVALETLTDVIKNQVIGQLDVQASNMPNVNRKMSVFKARNKFFEEIKDKIT